MDSEGNSANTNYENRKDRDALLSEFEPRLEKARELLSDDGVFFCSIDDRNHAYVKILLDRIFQSVNFISTLVWKARRGGGNDAKNVAVDHEYILVYAKDREYCNLIGIAKAKDDFEYEDEFVKTRGKYNLQQFDWSSLTYSKSLDYPISCPDGSIVYAGHVDKKTWEKRINDSTKRNDYCWLMAEDTFKKAYSKGFIVFKKNNEGKWNVRVKTYEKITYKLKDVERRFKLRSIIEKDNFNRNLTTKNGGNQYSEIMGTDYIFMHPKDVNLMSFLFRNFDNKNALILDFYAGSGTTGQAVLELNKEDGGNRKFILCVNNSGNSDVICKERLLRVMTGKTSKGESNFEWIKNNKPLGSSLDIYEIKEASTYYNVKNLLDEINEEDYGKQFKSQIKKIEWICDNFKVCTNHLSKPQNK